VIYLLNKEKILEFIQKKGIPFLMIFFVMTAFFYYCYVKAYYGIKVSRAESELETISKESLKAQETKIIVNKFEETGKYKELTAKLKNFEDEIKNVLPKTDEVSKIAESLQKYAAECDVEIINLNILNPSVKANFDFCQVKINIECKGTYKAFKKFLWSIENCAGFIFIEKLLFKSLLSDEKIKFALALESFVRN